MSACGMGDLISNFLALASWMFFLPLHDVYKASANREVLIFFKSCFIVGCFFLLLKNPFYC
jgi:hypothetical protein